MANSCKTGLRTERHHLESIFTMVYETVGSPPSTLRASRYAFSFSNALKRCEMVFFFALSISAYVSPSYSKTASQPGLISQLNAEIRYGSDVEGQCYCISCRAKGEKERTKAMDLPKFGGPRAGTILPYVSTHQLRTALQPDIASEERTSIHTSVLPWNSLTSFPGPSQNAKVHTASADLSSYAARRLFKPTWPTVVMNHLLPKNQLQRP